MTLLTQYLDLIFHIDRTLQEVVSNYGDWTYGLIFLIIFLETGLVITPFLPGDSLLFMVGTLCGLGLLSWPAALGLCALAAILGDQLNFYTGRYLSQYLLSGPMGRWIMPLIRTFAPFVAGLGAMNSRTFTLYNAGGAMLWVASVLSMGLWFGQLAWVRAHLEIIIWALILVPSVLAIWGTWRAQTGHDNSPHKLPLE